MRPFGYRIRSVSVLLFCLTSIPFIFCSAEQEKAEEPMPSHRELNVNPFQKGNSMFKNGNYLEAIEFYSRDLDVNPDNPSSFNNRGLAKSRSGDKEGAIGDYTQALEIRQDYATAYNNRGFAKIKIADYQGAIQDLSFAIQFEPKYANAFNNRAVACWAIKEKKNACEDWKRAYDLGHIEAGRSYQKFCN
ncbi:tetratricopeptide repeat protein [Leptospira sp. WS92.C1]